MFHFPGFPSCTYWFSAWSMTIHHGGCPIRKSAAELICSWPQLIAACRVLLRLLMPRHSPCALISLNFFSNSFFSLFSRSLNHLSFANNCYGCCYFVFCHLCDKIVVTYSRFLERPMLFFTWLIIKSYSIICSFYFLIRLSMNISFGYLRQPWWAQCGQESTCALSTRFLFFRNGSPFVLLSSDSLGGHKWTRTTDLSVISRVL